VIDDFETSIDHWHCSSGDGSSAAFATDTGVFYGGAASFSLSYDVGANNSASCGQSYEAHQDWSGGTGLSLWMRTDEAGLRVTLMLFAGNPDDPTPFEAHVEPTSDWTEYVIPWTGMERAGWASEGGLSTLDPAQVLGYAFGVESGAGGNKGTLWVDDVSLHTGEIAEAAPTPTASPAATQTPEPDPTATPLSPTATPQPAAQPTTAPPTPTSEPETKSGGGICGSAAMILPMCAVVIVLQRRPKNQ
jgi:hypothetical protein